jgi:hypothetical protein
MGEDNNAANDRFHWPLPIYAAIGAVVIFLPIATFAYNFGELVYILIGAPIICLILLVVAIVIAFYRNWLRSLAILSMLFVYGTVTWGLFRNSLELHTTTQWLLHSKNYKSQVLAQPAPADGDFRHVEWDWWGWGSNDTSVYLVFDPNDSLSSLLKNHPTGRLSSELCGVSWTRRLQEHWYAVEFYTNTAWGSCD